MAMETVRSSIRIGSNSRVLTFEVRFGNWLRWCMGRTGVVDVRCGSVEGRWKSPQVWDVVEPNERVLNPVVDWDAYELQRAYLALPVKQQVTIKVCYFRHSWPDNRKARKIGCKTHEIGRYAEQAKRQMESMLG